MEMDIKEKVERFKAKAELFLEHKSKIFVEDINNDYYFCEIILIHSDFIEVQGFAGRRKGQQNRIYFLDILRLDVFEEREENFK